MIPARKFHSYGNDFLIVKSGSLPTREYGEFSRAICTPHFGVGADGCVMLEQLSSREFKLRIFNRDGSEAGMSGNGARCAAAFVHQSCCAESGEVIFQTVSGEKTYRLLKAIPPVWRYVSSLGVPSFEPEDIPIEDSQGHRISVDWELTVANRKISVVPVSVGNPQCVVFVEDLPESPEFEEMGRELECHSFFPERTNVSFVQVLGQGRIAIKIWERGVGPTHSSGTGSSGAGVAAIQSGIVSSPVRVSTETGTQLVEWEPPGQVMLTGEARFVAEISFYWEGR
ncbi:MAG: diaminopimelate epimerase, partial [bacterium]